MNRYDWSKLDAGWEERAGELRYYEGNGTVYPFGVAWLENNSRYLREIDPRWHELHDQARAQLAKCRIRDTEPAPAECDIVDRMPAWPQGEVIDTLSNKPPWRRGPLASWTLVNIAAHDGRLTVVMKRGRGELIDETGPDDDALWERLAAKVVDYEKAKAKAKEKSDG